MSSKRKNTPTKLYKDNIILERLHSDTSECDNSNLDSEGETEINYSARFLSKSDSSEDFHDSDSGSDKPPNKKQRILQSIRHDSESEPETELQHNVTTKPNAGLHRKSMESVLQRLNSKSPGVQNSDIERTSPLGSADHEGGVLENVNALLRGKGSIQDKSKKIVDMISQLQKMNESLKKQGENIRVRIPLFLSSIFFSFFLHSVTPPAFCSH